MEKSSPLLSFCASCPLASHEDAGPVFPETHANDKYIILGEAPGSHECLEGRPFVGPSGFVLQSALEKAGIRRDHCAIGNAICCRPPNNDLQGLEYRLQRKGKEGPRTICSGRVEKFLGHQRNHAKLPILVLGKTAAQAVIGGAASIMALRGSGEVQESGRKVFFTLHPSFVLRNPVWKPVFERDIAKAFRFFHDKLDWTEPSIDITNEALAVVATLAAYQNGIKPVAYDIETDGIDVATCRIRCIAFSDGDSSLVIPFRGIDGGRLMTMNQESKLLTVIRSFMEDPQVKLIGHNAGQFDRLVVEHQWGFTPRLDGDTILLHLLADNELPHGLGFCGSHYTDFTETWKSEGTAKNPGSDEALHIYCGKDAAVTQRIAGPLYLDVRKRRQKHLVHRERILQELGAAMQRNGLYIDPARWHQHSADLEKELKQSRAAAQGSANMVGFNPGSGAQVSHILFDRWGLPVYKVSEKTGNPSVDADSLRAMLLRYPLTVTQRDFIREVRRYRRAQKLLGTYIRPLARKYVVHPSYNRLPATGRYSSSGPNSQNIPYIMRDMFIAPKGAVLVGADADQLEYRVIAEEAKAKHSLAWINGGLDPHNETMEIVYGKGVWDLPGAPEDRKAKGKGKFKNARDVTKNTRYAWQYAASAKRIHEQITSVEDDKGELIFGDIALEEVRAVVAGLGRADPEIPRWWERIQEDFRVHGYIADSLWGRRRYFRNEDKINELVNHPIQAGGAHLIHEGMIELFYGPQEWFATEAVDPPDEILPMDWLMNHGHDALYLYPPEKQAERVAELLAGAMTRRRKEGALLVYTAEADVGERWNEV